MKDLPWMKFTVNAWMSDEKLSECSPHAHGIMINLMCVLHKQKEYGTLLLKQKDKQKLEQVLKQNVKQLPGVCLPFAIKLTKNMPFMMEEILTGLEELLDEDVIQIEGDKLSQKRMIADRAQYLKKARAGSKGGSAQASAQAKMKASASADSISYISSLNSGEEEEESEKKEKSQVDQSIDEVITYLNTATGRTFRLDTKSSRKFIRARLRGYTVQDLFDVIDLKTMEWQGTNEAMYLRPETLFNETKFESYYQTVQDKKHGRIKKTKGFQQGDRISRKRDGLDKLKRALYSKEGETNETCSVDIS